MALTIQEVNEVRKILDNPSKPKTERVKDFYGYLETKGEAYGRLGGEVSNNNTWQGQIANGHVENGSRDNGGGFEHGSPKWTDLNYDLADRHWKAYDENKGETPTRKQVQDYHNEEYEKAGLDADDWLPNKLLNSSENPDAKWSDWMANNGPLDLWEDVFDILDQSLIVIPGTPPSIYLDPRNLDFTNDLLKAMWDMDPTARRQLLDDFTKYRDLFDILDQLKDRLGKLPDDFGWIFDNPDAVFHLLPPWAQDLWNDWNGANSAGAGGGGCPLVLDLGAVGIELLDRARGEGVYWDIDRDGFKEASGWVGKTDGLLAIDANNNGVIDDHGELFGDQTAPGLLNGFEALKAHDSNRDGKITAADANFNKLLVWIDVDSNGMSRAGVHC